MNNVAIKVEDISKRYRIGQMEISHDTLVGAFTSWVKSPIANFLRLKELSKFSEKDAKEDIIWALKNVSFEVKQGEVFGIIGANGAGKSTLLKVLSKISEPTSGRIEINGRVASLLEVGTGFHPDLTGRENVYLNGSILGMTKLEIDKNFDEIIDFSSIEKFIDTPVKRYSSGMRVRLAFSVAAFLSQEVLLIDEVLAVGDMDFQKKCIGKIGDVSEQGRTVLFVSHNMAAVSSLCSRACLIDSGNLVFIGETKECISQYIGTNKKLDRQKLDKRSDRHGNQKLKFVDIRIKDLNGNTTNTVASGDDLIIETDLLLRDDKVRKVYFQINIIDNLGRILLVCSTEIINKNYNEIKSNGKMICTIPYLPLSPGNYSVFLTVKEMRTVKMDWIENAIKFNVIEGDYFGTGRLLPSKTAPFLTKFDIEYISKI